jgi:hypothetical protein
VSPLYPYLEKYDPKVAVWVEKVAGKTVGKWVLEALSFAESWVHSKIKRYPPRTPDPTGTRGWTTGPSPGPAASTAHPTEGPMLMLICSIAFAVFLLCAYAAVRGALRRRHAPAAAPASEEAVLALLRSGRRVAAVSRAKELTDGDTEAALALVERLETDAGR